MVWLNRSPIPVGRGGGGNFLFQLIFTCLPSRRGRGGGWDTGGRHTVVPNQSFLCIRDPRSLPEPVFRIRIHMFLGLPDPDPDPLVRGMDPDWIRILPSSSKNSKKNFYSYCFVTIFGLFILENEVNVPSKNKKQKYSFLLAS